MGLLGAGVPLRHRQGQDVGHGGRAGQRDPAGEAVHLPGQHGEGGHDAPQGAEPAAGGGGGVARHDEARGPQAGHVHRDAHPGDRRGVHRGGDEIVEDLVEVGLVQFDVDVRDGVADLADDLTGPRPDAQQLALVPHVGQTSEPGKSLHATIPPRVSGIADEPMRSSRPGELAPPHTEGSTIQSAKPAVASAPPYTGAGTAIAPAFPPHAKGGAGQEDRAGLPAHRARRSSSTRSVLSHEKSGRSLPKWP